MFVRRKNVKSRGKTYSYYQLVENQKDELGRWRQKVCTTLGRVEEFDPERAEDMITALEDYAERLKVVDPEEDLGHEWAKGYGHMVVLGRLWSELGLDGLLEQLLRGRKHEFDVEAALRGMVLNRCVRPESKLSAHEWLGRDVYFPEVEGLEPHHLYRAMDFLIENKRGLETRLFNRLTDLFSMDVSVVFYDCTLVEMDGETPSMVEYSRNGRPEFLVGLALSRDGLPLAHEVLPGSTADISTVRHMLERLQDRFSIGRCIFVGDRGMVSKEKLREIKGLGYDYIVGVRLGQWKEVKEQVLARPGRYRELEENLRVKEVRMEDSRYVVCYNPKRAERDKDTRESIVAELEEEIDGLDPDTKEAARLWTHPVKSRYLRKLKDGRLRIDRGRMREDGKYDGKYVLRTSDEELSGEEIARTYRRLSRIERSFRCLKSLNGLRPVYHHAERRVRSHVALCVLAHLLERRLEQKLEAEGVNMTAARAITELGRLQVVRTTLKGNTYLCRTEATGQINTIFRALHYQIPSRVQQIE